MFSVDSTTRRSHLCLLLNMVELSTADQLFSVCCSVRESVHRGSVHRVPAPTNGEPVVLYRRPPVVLLLAHNVRSQLYRCTAVLRVPLANKGDWTDDAAIVLFTVPLLVWSSYARVTSAQNNRNIRLDLFPK